MLLFKKIKNKNPAAEEVQLKILKKWKICKQNIATCLQQKSELLSVQSKKYSLVFFCVLLGGSSTAIIIHSATATEKIAITKPSKPAYSMQAEKSYLQPDSSITKAEYDRVIGFTNYLFHLKNDPITKKKFDSIMQSRPQLIDSINLFEKMYLQQK